METLLSLLLGQRVKIKCVLPGDINCIADESSLFLMDILVELEDGTWQTLSARKSAINEIDSLKDMMGMQNTLLEQKDEALVQRDRLLSQKDEEIKRLEKRLKELSKG